MALPEKLKQMVGTSSDTTTFEIEKSQVRRFAQAIGENAKIHTDEDAAKKAGFNSLVGTPTFAALFFNADNFLLKMGVDIVSAMHVEEQYEYYRPVCAGDTLNIAHKVADVYEKQAPNGQLIFMVLESRASDLDDELVCKGRRVLVLLRK